MRTKLEPYLCDQELWPVVCPVNTPPSSAVVVSPDRLLFSGYTSLPECLRAGESRQAGCPKDGPPPNEQPDLQKFGRRNLCVHPAHTCHRRRSTCMLWAINVKEVMGRDATSLMLLLICCLEVIILKFTGGVAVRATHRDRLTNGPTGSRVRVTVCLSDRLTDWLTASQETSRINQSRLTDWLTKGQQKEEGKKKKKLQADGEK